MYTLLRGNAMNTTSFISDLDKEVLVLWLVAPVLLPTVARNEFAVVGDEERGVIFITRILHTMHRRGERGNTQPKCMLRVTYVTYKYNSNGVTYSSIRIQ
jgi:hypothetical protein